MKIGILTLPLHTNYGGILQAYALLTILKQMNHDVILIDLRGSRIKNALSELIRKKTIHLDKYLNDFILKYISKTAARYGLKDTLLQFPSRDYDAIIVGSDQVWRYDYCSPIITRYFLDFVKDGNIKKIVYAASFGTDKWEYDSLQTEKLAELIKDFCAISVREFSGIDMCKDKLRIEASYMVDPTLLLEKESYLNLVKKKHSLNNSCLLSYILDENELTNTVIKKVSTILSCENISINCKEKKVLRMNIKRFLSIEEWIEGFNNCKYVVTDSFHGCVFSIIFNKPFIVIGNEERGMCRFHSLLSIFGLENRMINSLSELTDDKIQESIDWTKIRDLKKELQEKSFLFLKNSLL